MGESERQTDDYDIKRLQLRLSRKFILKMSVVRTTASGENVLLLKGTVATGLQANNDQMMMLEICVFIK